MTREDLPVARSAQNGLLGGSPAPASSALVSIVMPTHNRAPLLRNAIRSALAQTYSNIEILVMDDASTDQTEAIVREIDDPRLKYVRHPTRFGLEKNYASGLASASGKYVAFLSDDDRWQEEFVSNRVAALEAHPQRVVAFSGYQRCNEEFQVTGRFAPRLPEDVTLPPEILLDAALRREFTIASSLYVRNSLVSAWPLVEGCGGAFDTALQLQIAIRHPDAAVYMPWCDILYTIHPGQASVSPHHFEQGCMMYRATLASTSEVPWAFRRIRRDFSAWQVTFGRIVAARGDLRAARRLLARALITDPLNIAAWSQFLVSLVLPSRLRRP